MHTIGRGVIILLSSVCGTCISMSIGLVHGGGVVVGLNIVGKY